MPFGNINVDTVTTSTTGGILGAGNASIMKNRIINGAMVVSQRNGTSSVTANDGTFSVDRWKCVATANGKFTMQQNAGSITPPVGFSNYLGCTSTAATAVGSGDFYQLRQVIEGFNFSDCGWGTANAKTVTLSFWVYSSLTGTFGGSVFNSAASRSYPFSFTINSANTWEYETITIAGDTTGTWIGATNGGGLQVGFGFGSGATYTGTANAWAATYYNQPTGSVNMVATNGATFYITGVQLEVGSSATGFEYVNYQTSLANCQRYYYKVTATSANKGFSAGGQCFSTVGAIASVPFPVTMRTIPTALEQSGTAGDYRLFGSATNAINCSAVPTFNGTTNQNIAVVEGTVSSGLVVGNSTFMAATNTSAYLGWSAEL